MYLANVFTEVVSKGIVKRGSSGTTTLYLSEKKEITSSKLLSPPISPCNTMIGVPSPCSIYENLPSFFTSVVIGIYQKDF